MTDTLFDTNGQPNWRLTDPATSRTAGKNAAVRAGSQKAQLLEVFADPAHWYTGLTSWDAGHLSGLADKPGCCYWKRVSELHAAGLLEAIGTRAAPTGETQTVYRITTAGRAAA